MLLPGKILLSHHLQVENEAGLAEVRELQDRLDMSEHVSEGLRRELREQATRKTQMHTELHQARMHVAQLTLQLSEENLVLREERATWVLEREAYKQAAEVRIQRLILHTFELCNPCFCGFF